MANVNVAIIGGGVAGLTAADELSKRPGFNVTVYERQGVFGGKARSYRLTGTGLNGNADLPAEHGFRFLPGFYQHLPETMRGIPSPYGQSVYDHLVNTRTWGYAQNGQPLVQLPTQIPRTRTDWVQGLQGLFSAPQFGLSPAELLFFAKQMTGIASICDARRLKEFESVSWWDFMHADHRSPQFRKILVEGLTRNFVAMRPRRASAWTGTNILMQFFEDLFQRFTTVDRILDGPTSDVWINPWVAQLQARGVVMHNNVIAEAIAYDSTSTTVTGVAATQNGNPFPINADVFILAVPVDRARTLLQTGSGPTMKQVDPSLAEIDHLEVSWMNGVIYYLKAANPATTACGHVLYADSPWALTSISPLKHWHAAFNDLTKIGDGSLAEIMSVIISDWQASDPTYPAANTSASAAVVSDLGFKQVISHVGGFTPADIVHSEVDNSIAFSDPLLAQPLRRVLSVRDFTTFQTQILPHLTPAQREAIENAEPMLVNTIDSFSIRPDAVTGIKNFFLASDYVKTNVDLATMEGANEAAKRAVNGVLKLTNASGARCPIYEFEAPAAFAWARRADRVLFAAGLPCPWAPN